MNKAILIHEQLDHIEEIDLNIIEIYSILGGRATFIGQWPEIDVVIMKAEHAELKNHNILPQPFNKEETFGKILLVRMDENSEPQDFLIEEYEAWVEQKQCP